MIKHWELASFIFTLVVGTFFHFIYELSGQNKLIGFISPVSESTWEHLKMLFFPMLIFALIEYCFVKAEVDACLYFRSKLIGLVMGMLTIIITFYTYSGILGNHIVVIDIIIFILGIIVAHLFFAKTIKKTEIECQSLYILIFYLFIIALFIYFTKKPPQIGLFTNA